MKIARSLITLIAGGLILLPVAGYGATCSVSTTAVAFGAYNPLGSVAVDSTGTVTVTCDDNTQVTVAIGPSGVSGGFSPRQLLQASGSDRLNYNLYTTSSRTTIWGDGTQGTSTWSGNVLRRRPSALTVYGRAPAAQDVYIGTYTDSLVVTITY